MLLQMIQNLYIQNLIAVSSMKKSDGNYEEWATDPKYREEFLKHILIAYYVLFSLVLFLCFLVLPLNFFYHAGSRLAEEEEDDENNGFFKFYVVHSFIFTEFSVKSNLLHRI